MAIQYTLLSSNIYLYTSYLYTYEYTYVVVYTCTGASKPQLTNINVKVCLGSRIAVLGANGAGKVRVWFIVTYIMAYCVYIILCVNMG